MTPSARVAAAIGVLDRTLAGIPAEQALLHWSRHSRFAGSKDRAAVRDHVYAALRCRRSFHALSGQAVLSGRSLMIGALRDGGTDPDGSFTGAGHAPEPLDASERQALDQAVLPPDGPVALDCPDWLEAPLRDALGPAFPAVLSRMRQRAPVFLRANLARGPRAAAQAALAAEGITAVPHGLADSALEVTAGAGLIRSAEAYLDGRVELQDAASQAVCAAVPLSAGMRVLDYCAGGGGKTLALAARMRSAHFFAHDAHPQRLRDLPVRAARARIAVTTLETAQIRREAPFDLVIADVPCSGSGTWARDPEAKWVLTPDRLAELQAAQAAILDRVAGLIRHGGQIAYMTCSLLKAENRAQIQGFLTRHPACSLVSDRQLTPTDGGDGFYMALLTRA